MSFQIKNTFSCHENWENMSQTERGKFCGICSKEVIDFTVLTKNEIVAVFKQNNYQPLCARALPSQLNTVYLEESLENVSWNLPFWQRFLLIFLVCFGPEFFNVQLVFAQDSTAIQTQELVQDSVQINDSLTTDVLKTDSINLTPNIDFGEVTSVPVTATSGVMMYDPITVIEFPQIDYEYYNYQLINVSNENDRKHIEKTSKKVKEIIAKNEFRPLRNRKQKAPSKKQIPQPLLFVPLWQSQIRRVDETIPS
ncbi:MAG: hypothetical protein EBQ94_08815 [Flavobacteriales bacterium]|nr:hypothetical protein [Flavobacteriales bacterium]